MSAALILIVEDNERNLKLVREWRTWQRPTGRGRQIESSQS